MVYFTAIKPTEHYLQEHERDVPWDKVAEIIFSTKNPRKKGDKFEIEKDGYYILFEVKSHFPPVYFTGGLLSITQSSGK